MNEYRSIFKKNSQNSTGYFSEAKKSDWYLRLKKRPGLQAVFVLIGIVLVLSVIAPYLAPHDPNSLNLYGKNQGPSANHLLGTDYLGRDLFSRVVCGLQTSMTIALTTIVFSFVIGVSVGSYSGYMGGRVDNIVARVIDVFLAFPSIILALALITLIGPGVFNMILMLAVVQWASLARIMRGQVLYEKNQEYVLSARASGFSGSRILLRHIIPNCIMPVVVLATLDIGHTILTVSTLSFLGMGIPPSVPEWGSMINSGLSYMRIAPLNVIVPGIAITIITLLFNMAGEGIRDITDTKSDGEGSL
ncbi:peptide/nickel transport system permease protein [Methanomicrobium sp. W14]|uniref:ABC transporter permease n=1 Tax=Methanomicrobium sp. W14 TaxID=2817839 RepID=UPI001AE4A4B5|nr:ABC transporter permease [Methanomicrobium sp. W14]MBP2132211.1 peptide/nickel transport system permease protein [Methanomicrobium sp. W14]